jgi:hypothetical protein
MADGKGKMNRDGQDTTKHRGNPPECFVIMPISDPDDYQSGHFQHVFDDLFVPACDKAGFRAVRADQVRETNLIHLDVLQKLIDSPMALCDLSSRNPNVLFELGLRQAFDKPVVLVQEVGTPKIFDIAPLRYTEYRKARIYHEVLEDQKAIALALESTHDAHSRGAGVNSIVKVLSITQPAKLVDIQEANKDPALQIIRAEISELRNVIQQALFSQSSDNSLDEEASRRYVRAERMVSDLERDLSRMLSTETVVPDLPTRMEIVKNDLAYGMRRLKTRDPMDRNRYRELFRRFDTILEVYKRYQETETASKVE